MVNTIQYTIFKITTCSGKSVEYDYGSRHTLNDAYRLLQTLTNAAKARNCGCSYVIKEMNNEI